MPRLDAEIYFGDSLLTVKCRGFRCDTCNYTLTHIPLMPSDFSVFRERLAEACRAKRATSEPAGIRCKDYLHSLHYKYYNRFLVSARMQA